MLTQPKTKYSLILIVAFVSACSAPNPRYFPHNLHVNNSQVIKAAKSQLGVDYKYGGHSPYEGFDCSGLVYYSFQQAGISLPRTTKALYKYSHPIKKPYLKRGDLVFFRMYRSRISHVGIYLGDNRFIHAPSTGKSVEIAHLNAPYWRKRFVRAGRI